MIIQIVIESIISKLVFSK